MHLYLFSVDTLVLLAMFTLIFVNKTG